MTRFGYVMTTYLMTLAIGVWALIHHTPRLIWNASASIPIGLYTVEPEAAPKNSDLVAVRPPQPLARFLAVRHYLPLDVLLLKHVAALPGQIVCRQGLAITINGRVVASALTRDHARRPLPVWKGCRTLAPGEVFLLNPGVPDSLDGRYFGPLPMASIVGRAAPFGANKKN